ncbi:hypothetical protein [Nisaea nitritireducens]|uniref:hypothetical protein n=1 Tax=Nisaea nitritireducens TaxID=568392 RepID=UPI001866962D|nr:hypothetical protein [Nisaea nitritireducens]
MFDRVERIASCKSDNIIDLIKAAGGSNDFLVGGEFYYCNLKGQDLSEFDIRSAKFKAALLDSKTKIRNSENIFPIVADVLFFKVDSVVGYFSDHLFGMMPFDVSEIMQENIGKSAHIENSNVLDYMYGELHELGIDCDKNVNFTFGDFVISLMGNFEADLKRNIDNNVYITSKEFYDVIMESYSTSDYRDYLYDNIKGIFSDYLDSFDEFMFKFFDYDVSDFSSMGEFLMEIMEHLKLEECFVLNGYSVSEGDILDKEINSVMSFDFSDGAFEINFMS